MCICHLITGVILYIAALTIYLIYCAVNYKRIFLKGQANGKTRKIPDREGNGIYLERLHLLARAFTLWLLRPNIHAILMSDDPNDGLHDHPWPYFTYILAGGYFEHLLDGSRVWRGPGYWTFRSAKSLHRLELEETSVSDGPMVVRGERTCWTLFIMGPRLRTWQFLVNGVRYNYDEWLKRRGYYNNQSEGA